MDDGTVMCVRTSDFRRVPDIGAEYDLDADMIGTLRRRIADGDLIVVDQAAAAPQSQARASRAPATTSTPNE